VGRTRLVTLDEYLDTRPAGFDVVRLLLAWLVLVSHTWPLGGFGPEPGSPLAPEFLTLGGFAVAGFFAMSGLLVGRSALRRTPGRFASARIMRIVPAYWVALVVSAFPVAWIGWHHERGTWRGFLVFTADGPWAYVGRAALFPVEFIHGVHDVFVASTPFGASSGSSFVNGSLWTLPYEMRCYLVVGLVALVARRFGSRRSMCAVWATVGVVAAAGELAPEFTAQVVGPIADPKLIALMFVFLTGSVLAAFGDRLVLHWWLPIGALVVGLLAGRASLFWAQHLSAATLAVVLPFVAMAVDRPAATLRGTDLSYGTYLYAWPVQMLLAMWGLDSGPWTFIAASTAVTVALAAASWYGVERPTMRRWQHHERRTALRPAA
jgi:peptidoglycan/LPS O-acetylase OafA/YrhL